MSFEFSAHHVFSGFELNAELAGSDGVTAVFGPSGSGKSTIIRMMAGLLKPDAGRFALKGRVLLDQGQRVDLPPHKRRLGLMFQDGRLFPHMTVQQNLDFGKRYAGNRPQIVDEETLDDILALGALKTRLPGSLSGGEAQRVALARALFSAPDMLLLDEPLAALDGPRKDEVLPYFDRLKTLAHLPILYVTHSVEELARLADHVALIDDGRIVQHGPVFDILSSPAAMPLIGVREAGSVLRATIEAHLPGGLTRLRCDAGPLELPHMDAELGSAVRVRVLARDVIVATNRPKGLSARNILPATIRAIEQGRGPGVAVVLDANGQSLLARITDVSRTELQLEPGQSVFAVLKSTAVARTAPESP